MQSNGAATNPAVSILNLVSPKATGVKLFCNANSILSFLTAFGANAN